MIWTVLVTPVPAAYYKVTGAADNTAAVTTAGHAGTAADPYLAPSLRSAVLAANNSVAANVILFDPALNGTPLTLSLVGNDDVGLVGDLDVTGALTIQGNGTNNTLIQGGPTPATGIDKIFSFNPLGARPGFTVVLAGLTIRNGRNSQSFASNNGEGGAFDFDAGLDGKGSLVVSNCALLNNSTLDGDGGAVALFDGGTVLLSGTVIVGNSVTNTSGAILTGGGLFVGSSSHASSLVLSNCIISANQVRGTNLDGGGLFAFGSYGAGTINYAIHASQITSNAAGVDGGGIYTTAPWVMDRGTLLAGNTAGRNGGGLWNNAAGTIVSNCTVLGCTAANLGGGLHQDSSTSASLTAIYSRVVGNLAGSGADLAQVAGTVVARQNWWGTNSPAPLLAGAVTYSPWLMLTLTATPPAVALNGSAALTASFLTNSALAYVPPSNLGTVIGLPVSFLNPVRGVLSGAQPAVTAAGTASATFKGTTPGAGSADVRIDNATVTAPITVNCPAISALVSGGSTNCAGGMAHVLVTLSGGSPPYTVTLNNGGGTQSGASPLSFLVAPMATTTYGVLTALDTNLCSATASGSATLTVLPAPVPVISVPAGLVAAYSATNQASVSGGFSSYAWSISNGTITSPTNLPGITYAVGAGGVVTLGVTVASSSGCLGAALTNLPIVLVPPVAAGCSFRTNYFASMTMTDALASTTMTLAYDGTNYWSCSGGGTGGNRYARYDASGLLLSTYAPGLDFRSIFTDRRGHVFARAVSSSIIYVQLSPGQFTNSGVSLSGGSLDSQASVILNGTGTEYIAMSGGAVSRWGTNGVFLGTVTLQGFGSVSGESIYPQNCGVATVGDYWLTYCNSNRVLSLWDQYGNRLGQSTLAGGGTTFDAAFSLSYCNGMAFIVSVAGGLWRGYEVCVPMAVAVLGAPSAGPWNSDVQLKIEEAGLIPQVNVLAVGTGGTVPTLAALARYQAVLVYSDSAFQDNVALGNVLADYQDLGGGVVLGAHVFDNAGGAALAGRFATGGYAPFTTGPRFAASGLSLLKDQPLHPILDGINVFNGGLSNYQNSPLTLASGGTLIAHWSSGPPLVGGKDNGMGRTAALNYFPPSSDVCAGGWQAGSDGGRLMANALLWGGKTPPTIVLGPSLSSVVSGVAACKVTAVGPPPLTYQWAHNGTNLPGATNATLGVTLGAGTGGRYTVAVFNPYGAAFSPAVVLGPLLRLLPPGLFTGTNSTVFVTTVDNTLLTAGDLSHIHLYASTNVAASQGPWTLVTNPPVLANGLLRVDGLPTNGVARFYRALTTP